MYACRLTAARYHICKARTGTVQFSTRSVVVVDDIATMTIADAKSQYNCLFDARLQGVILSLESDAYSERHAPYWAINAALYPSCVVQPHVSRIIKALAMAMSPQATVAIRSWRVSTTSGRVSRLILAR
jgi:hypothetical protein